LGKITARRLISSEEREARLSGWVIYDESQDTYEVGCYVCNPDPFQRAVHHEMGKLQQAFNEELGRCRIISDLSQSNRQRGGDPQCRAAENVEVGNDPGSEPERTALEAGLS
jgi:hypothetical protein